MRQFAFMLVIVLSGGMSSAIAQENGLELWDKIYKVLSHPRCSNCHVGSDNIPRWAGPSYGKTKLHGMNINAGNSRIGSETITCNTCHTKQNTKIPHGPPGAPVWALAPVEMQWLDKSSAEICAQIKNPDLNGGRTIEKVADHIDHDKLVHWGWTPGPGREAAPFSKEELVRFIQQWDTAGAPCPTK